MALYYVAGMAQKIELPVPLIVHLLPISQKQRPGIKRALPGYSVIHETANYNPGADAAMHDRWLHSGANGGYVSFHFCYDDQVIYQFVPVDEVTWQSADGAGPGNMSGISSEQCRNQGINKAKARMIGEALHGGIHRALGMPSSLCCRHWDFNQADPDRHHCPNDMMNEGYWPTFVANVDKIITAGVAADPVPAYPPANPIPFIPGKGWDPVDTNGATWFPMALQVTALKNAVPRQYAASDAPPVAATIRASDSRMATGWVEAKDGKAYLILAPENGRALASSFTPAITLAKRERTT